MNSQKEAQKKMKQLCWQYLNNTELEAGGYVTLFLLNWVWLFMICECKYC